MHNKRYSYLGWLGLIHLNTVLINNEHKNFSSVLYIVAGGKSRKYKRYTFNNRSHYYIRYVSTYGTRKGGRTTERLNLRKKWKTHVLLAMSLI